MTDDLHTALRSTLKTASREAPAPEPDLLNRLAKRHRTRRHRRLAAVTAAVVAVPLVVGGTAFVLPSGGERANGPLTAGTPSPMAMPEPVSPPKAALRALPDTLPGGREYGVKVVLDDDSLLVSTFSGFEKADQLWVYDLRTRKATKVTDVVQPAGTKLFASGFAVGDGQVAWWLLHTAAGRPTIEIWAAPLSGGKARKLAAMPTKYEKWGQSGLTGLAVEGGKVRWDAGQIVGGPDTGVYEMSLDGGPARVIPGTAGHRIFAWPWIGRPGVSQGKDGEAAFHDLRNVKTGQTLSARLPEVGNTWTCGITWCLGMPADASHRGRRLSYAVSRDGEVRVLPGDPARRVWSRPLSVRYFAYIGKGSGDVSHILLYDVETGKLVDLGPGGSGPGGSDSGGSGPLPKAGKAGTMTMPTTVPSAYRADPRPERYLLWRSGGSVQLVDLDAIR
ncbi:hypothetical protein ACFY4C_08430 [Actinomadura viridis]|uniref:hypothetical protein n=1 Tax=Actinomadura viridis TaxID=58110 RepID=UPI0036C9C066